MPNDAVMGVRAWLLGVATGMAVAGLGAYFVVAGLGEASEVAGVVGLFVGLAGLAVSMYGVRQAHRDATAAEGGQSVIASRTAGRIVQVRGVRGSVRIGEKPPIAPRRSSGEGGPAPGPAVEAEHAGGQSVTGSEAGGGITQVDGVGGDVDVGR